MSKYSEIILNKSSYPVYSSAGHIDMMSNKGFFTFKNERFITQITDGTEVFALAGLTFDENLLIGGGRSVRCPH